MNTVLVVLLQFTCLTVMLESATSNRLPDYITACKADNTLDACSLKHGQAAIKRIIKGDPKYKLPKLDPLLIPKLVINQGNNQIGLNLTLTNCNIHGLGKAKFTASRMDLKRKHIEWDFLLPKLSLVGDYQSRGKILVLPITGDGPGNITLVNMYVSYIFDYVLEKKKGEDYVKLTHTDLKFNATRMYIKMSRLFNGDKTLGDAMHRFLDENWKEVLTELGPSVGEAIGSVFQLLISNIASLVPYKHIFLMT